MGEGRLRPEVRDGQGPLERPGRGQNFAPDRGQVVGGERSAVLRGQRPQDLSFPLRNIRRRPLPSFEVADLKGGLGALVEEVEDLVIEFVDPGPPVGQVHRNTCPRECGDYRRTFAGDASYRPRASAGGGASAAPRSALTSRGVSLRYRPRGRSPSCTGPNAIRRSRRTRWPSAAQ